MPIYEYRCDSCGRVFEVIQKFSDEPLQLDPECGKGPVERLISAPAFQFKGTGFYITDYAKGKDGGAVTPKSESKSSDAGASSESSSNSSSSETKSSDSKKSETKSESSSSSSSTKAEPKTESKPPSTPASKD